MSFEIPDSFKVKNSKVYFASDFHLGVPDQETSNAREKSVIQWLEMAEKDAEAIFLVGDVFDFWFEYATVIPKGFVRLQGKIASICDKGIPVYWFTGNHDMWAFDYLPKELGVNLIREPKIFHFQGKNLYVGHGDGLGPGDYGYKFIKKVFANPFFQWLFARLHPNFGIRMASFCSGKSRGKNPPEEYFKNEQNEWLWVYCKELIQKHPEMDYFIFGHRHLALNLPVSETSRYINLGEWFSKNTYAVLENGVLTMYSFRDGRQCEFNEYKVES